MSTDPVTDGQRVQAWKVRINFAGRRECDTEIYIRESNHVVGHARNYRLRPGVHEIAVPAAEAFRVKRRESCINIQADLEGSRQQVDSSRKFCARPSTLWSCASPKIAAPGGRRGTKTNSGMKANQTFIPSPSAFILSHVPHTFAAVSSITSSLRNCSSSVSRLPRRLEAKPHCGLIANCSRGR